MDPDLEPFMRLKPKHLQLLQATELEDACTCLAQSADASLIAAGCCEHSIAIYNLELVEQHILEGHAGGTNSLAFAKGGKLVSTGEDGHAAVWDCNKGTCLARLACEGEHVDRTPDGHTVDHAVCNPSGSLAAVAAGKTLHVFELETDDYEKDRRKFPPVSGGVIEDVRFLKDDRLIIAYYGGVSILSTEAGAAGMILDYGTNIYSAAATPSLQYVVGGCMDSCVHIWQFSSKEGSDKTELVEFSCGGYTTKVSQVAFDSQGTALASIGGTQATVWDFTGAGPSDSIPVVTLGHTKNCTCQAWQPTAGSTLLTTGGKDGRVLMYDTTIYAEPDEEGIPKFAGPIAVAPEPQPDEVTALVWSAVDPMVLYVGHASGTLRCWRLPEKAQAEA